LAALRRGLNEAGYVEGRNVSVEYRWAENRNDRLPSLVSDLASRRCAVIIAGGNAPARVAKATATNIPIVFVTGDDPIDLGFVTSLSKPTGNLTGATFFAGVLGVKQLELLREVVPKATLIGMLVNRSSPAGARQAQDAQTAARATGQNIHILGISDERDFDDAFATFRRLQVGALLMGGDAIFTGKRDQLVALAASHGLPTMYGLREFTEAGGLMSYGASATDAYRQAGAYAARILQGAKPSDLPVMQPTKFEFLVNLRTAKTLGLAIPQSILVRADEVIE
jgi:putative ABC transport system substrate-binding protein